MKQMIQKHHEDNPLLAATVAFLPELMSKSQGRENTNRRDNEEKKSTKNINWVL